MGFPPQKKKVDGTIPFFTYNNQINYKFIKLKPLNNLWSTKLYGFKISLESHCHKISLESIKWYNYNLYLCLYDEYAYMNKILNFIF